MREIAEHTETLPERRKTAPKLSWASSATWI
jgi:hypothetical protein